MYVQIITYNFQWCSVVVLHCSAGVECCYLLMGLCLMLKLIAVDASLVRTAADSLLPIVQSQRERFRVRAQELETVCNEWHFSSVGMNSQSCVCFLVWEFSKAIQKSYKVMSEIFHDTTVHNIVAYLLLFIWDLAKNHIFCYSGFLNKKPLNRLL